jgi:hypothetical protein
VLAEKRLYFLTGVCMHKTSKNTKYSIMPKLLKFLAVASIVLGAFAVLYLGGLSAISLAAGQRHYSGQNHRYGYPSGALVNSTPNQSMPNGTAPYFSGSATRYGIAGTMQANLYGLFSGVLMVLLGAVTLKYAKLRMKLSS